MSAVVLLWVLLKMKYRGHREIVQVSLRKMLIAVCMESAAFLLAIKILIRRQPHRNSMIAVAFLGALALIVVKGFVSTEKTVNFVAAPAGASAPGGVSAPAVASAARPVIPRDTAILPVIPHAFAIPPPLPHSQAALR